MAVLDRKLARDLRRMWSQALTIALVVASGMAAFLTTLGAVDSLAAARTDFYAEAHFADVFASVRRAPASLVERARTLPGVAEAQGTLEQSVRVRLDGVDDPIIGHLVGVDPRAPSRLNRVTLRSGQALPDGGGERADAAIPAWVSEGFAQARSLRLGDELAALVNGRERRLRIVGIALSPEYVFASFGGMPDMHGFGVFWIDRGTLAAAYDMEGAVNRLALRLAPGASEAAVLAGLDRLLEPYGGREAHGREDQTSHAMLDAEIREMRTLGTLLPSIFLGVAAFLLNVVVSRLVATQREQIAALKALGYGNGRIAAHYLKMVLVIVALGLLIGTGLGKWLGLQLTALYGEFFHFPAIAHRLSPALWLAGATISVGAGAVAVANSLAATMRLSPAEAMRPSAPGRYQRGIGEWRRLPLAARMVLRSLRRRPLRSLFSLLGVAVAVAIVVMGNFVRDAMDHIVDAKFNLEMRSDIIVWTADAVPTTARHELARLPAALAVQADRQWPVRFGHGHLRERGVILGVDEPSPLLRVIDIDGREVPIADQGLVMSERLLEKLGLRPGDSVLVESLQGRAQSRRVPVVAGVRDMMGLNAYMRREALNRLFAEGDLASQFQVATERGREPDFLRAAMQLPRIVGAFGKASLWRNMQEISSRNIRIMSTVLTLFACVIAVGVVYNNIRITLAERSWELASLRVLGFTPGEVATLLLGEMALLIALALPLGMLLGYGLVHLLAEMLRSDQYSFPVVVQARTYAIAGLAVLAAALASAWIVRRNIHRLDMVAALKTRE